MTKLLILKHWQIFGLLIGLPLIIEAVTMSVVVQSQNPGIFVVVLPIIMVFTVVIFFGWFYALGINLHRKLPASINMNLNRFKMFLFIPVAYMLVFSVFVFYMMSNISSGTEPTPLILAIIVPLHLFSMFCIFYCLYFNAKALKTVELEKEVTFSDFAGEFFLIWLFPIGIWIIQPRLNKLFDTSSRVDKD